MGYLCANFSQSSRPLCSRLRPDVRDRQTNRRQTDVRQKHRLMPPPYGGGDNKMRIRTPYGGKLNNRSSHFAIILLTATTYVRV